jgi:hypothetical protein
MQISILRQFSASAAFRSCIAGLLNVHVVRETSAKFGLQLGNMKLNTHNKE